MSPSEAEVDFTQSQEPMIPPVICQGPSTDQVVASIPSKLPQSSSPSLIQ